MDCTIDSPISGRLSLFFFLFSLLLAPAFAFDCTSIDNQEDCLELQNSDPSLIPDLFYQDHRTPNHDFIEDYNAGIPVQPTQKYNSGNIRDAWLEVPYIYPSIVYNADLLSNTFRIRGDYDFSYSIPSDYYNSRRRNGRTCRIRYYFDSKSADVRIYADNRLLSTSFGNLYSISRESTFRVEVTFRVTIRERYYEWDYEGDGDWDCDYDYTSYDTDTLTLSRSFTVKPYSLPSAPSFTYLYEYNSKYWGELSEYDGNMELSIADDYLKREKYLYYARFIEPFEYLQLYATESNFTTQRGVYSDNDLLIAQEKTDCQIEYYDFFRGYTRSCDENIQPMQVEEFKEAEPSANWTFLLWLIVFIFINIVIYKIIRHYWHWF